MKQNIYLFIVCIASMQISCTKNNVCEDAPDTSSVNININVQRIDNELYAKISEDNVYALMSEHPDIKYYFMDGRNMPVGEVENYLFGMINNPSADTIQKEVTETFGDLKDLEAELTNGFKLLKYYYPDTKNQTIKTFNSGLRKDLYINDSTVVIGLDYFLGDKATYRPNNYDYINKRYKPKSISSFVFTYISNKYNMYDELDNTLLSEMIFYGKSYYFTKKMLPCVADSVIIGYEPVDWDGSELHLKKIWAAFVERELWYQTSHMIVSKYVGERPKVVEIANNCPGRIGRYLGWKIVNAYMERHPEVTLQDLMKETDSKKIFIESKYKPE